MKPYEEWKQEAKLNLLELFVGQDIKLGIQFESFCKRQYELIKKHLKEYG